MLLPVTLTIAAAAAFLNLWLSERVVAMRMSSRTMIGEGGDADGGQMRTRVRAHANLTEYAPFVLILMGLLELSGQSATWLWVAGAAFVLGRVLHPLGLERPAPNALRAGGMALTWGVLLVLAGWGLAVAYSAGDGGDAGPRVELDGARA